MQHWKQRQNVNNEEHLDKNNMTNNRRKEYSQLRVQTQDLTFPKQRKDKNAAPALSSSPSSSSSSSSSYFELWEGEDGKVVSSKSAETPQDQERKEISKHENSDSNQDERDTCTVPSTPGKRKLHAPDPPCPQFESDSEIATPNSQDKISPLNQDIQPSPQEGTRHGTGTVKVSSTACTPKKKQKKRHRRTADMIDRQHVCHYFGCGKSYGSEASLNQHAKIKHRGAPPVKKQPSNHIAPHFSPIALNESPPHTRCYWNGSPRPISIRPAISPSFNEAKEVRMDPSSRGCEAKETKRSDVESSNVNMFSPHHNNAINNFLLCHSAPMPIPTINTGTVDQSFQLQHRYSFLGTIDECNESDYLSLEWIESENQREHDVRQQSETSYIRSTLTNELGSLAEEPLTGERETEQDRLNTIKKTDELAEDLFWEEFGGVDIKSFEDSDASSLEDTFPRMAIDPIDPFITIVRKQEPPQYQSHWKTVAVNSTVITPPTPSTTPTSINSQSVRENRKEEIEALCSILQNPDLDYHSLDDEDPGDFNAEQGSADVMEDLVLQCNNILEPEEMMNLVALNLGR